MTILPRGGVVHWAQVRLNHICSVAEIVCPYYNACVMKRSSASAALIVQPSTSADRRQGLWTVGQVAQFLGVSKRWVHERTRRNEIPCYRLGTALRFDPEEIRAWAAKFHNLPQEGA